jgi:hypothetical protein
MSGAGKLSVVQLKAASRPRIQSCHSVVEISIRFSVLHKSTEGQARQPASDCAPVFVLPLAPSGNKQRPRSRHSLLALQAAVDRGAAGL